MRIVIDTNLILSAIIKNSATRHMIMALEAEFYYPDESLDEIFRNKGEVLEKAGISEEEFNKIFLTIFKYLRLIKRIEFEKNIKKAEEIIGKIHKNDVIFVAAALTKDAIIWSNDEHFKKQNEVAVLTTKEIILNYKKL